MNPMHPTRGLPSPLRIGVSACVLGHEVRFDGGHKLDRYIRDSVGAFAEFVAVCPETEIGLGTPRETLRLLRRAGQSEYSLVAPKSQSDHSAAMKRYAIEKAEQLKALLRENFFERVFAYRRLKDLFSGPWTLRDLMAFHANEKLLLMAHADYRPLGQLVANGRSMDAVDLESRYKVLFLQALSANTSVGKHANVLQHIAGYFRKGLDACSRREVHDQIDAYHQRLLPLVVPLTLIRHHIRRLELGYLQGQSYLWPHPQELMLRNHA